MVQVVSAKGSPLALLVDHQETREMYACWLQYSGFRVAEASTAEEALQLVFLLHPDVIATGVGLSGGDDGCALCEQLKRDERTRAIPVIAVTAWALGEQFERALMSGCDSVLVKPCLPEDLLKEIRRLLNW
jgi:CheY-like chemotaxis protein